MNDDYPFSEQIMLEHVAANDPATISECSLGTKVVNINLASVVTNAQHQTLHWQLFFIVFITSDTARKMF